MSVLGIRAVQASTVIFAVWYIFLVADAMARGGGNIGRRRASLTTKSPSREPHEARVNARLACERPREL